MVTHIVMPVRNQQHLTRSICDQLQEMSGWDRCWIMDNGSIDSTARYLKELCGSDDRFTDVQAGGRLIYEMWNQGFGAARGTGADYVAIINNDLDLSPDLFTSANTAMLSDTKLGVVYPDYDLEVAGCAEWSGLRYTAGTYRHGGMSGFCFMLRSVAVDWAPLVDPRFLWWGGDDDIAFNLEARGWLQARLEGQAVDHLHEGTARHHDLGETKAADMARIIEKWGR